MSNKPSAFESFSIRIPIIVPIKGRGFINWESTLAAKCQKEWLAVVTVCTDESTCDHSVRQWSSHIAGHYLQVRSHVSTV